MKRSFPPPARQALCALVGALACGSACAPSNSVKPGAPQLVEFTIVQAGPTATTITPTTPECVSPIASGAACLPTGSAAGADGGTAAPPDTLCRDAPSTWCTCVADGMDGSIGTWSCEPFSNVMAVIAVFDRLLDTAPLDPGDAAGLSDVVTTMATSGAPVIELQSDYSSTGQADGLVFNNFGPAFFGNFRGDGPSLFAAPQPEFPSAATVTVTLDASKVRAKDGTTPFTGAGLLQGGTLVFTMAPFAVSVFPQAMPSDMNPDPPKSATVAFTNFVDTGTTPAHITATSNGTNVPVDAVSSDNGASFAVLPVSGEWVAGATIVVTVDAPIENLLGQMLTVGASATFVAR